MNARALKIAPFLFGSGLCALIYQTEWQRELRLIFGASTALMGGTLPAAARARRRPPRTCGGAPWPCSTG